MSILTYSEQIASEQIMHQTNAQLEYTANEFNYGEEFDFVEFMIIPEGKIAFPVVKNFFLTAILMELEYRKLEHEITMKVMQDMDKKGFGINL